MKISVMITPIMLCETRKKEKNWRKKQGGGEQKEDETIKTVISICYPK